VPNRRVRLQSDAEFLAIRDALFARAVLHFKKLGKLSFLCIQGKGDAQVPDIPDSFEVKLVRAIVAAPLFPAWAAF